MVEKSKRFSKTAKGNYISKWPYFNLMSFLQKYINDLNYGAIVSYCTKIQKYTNNILYEFKKLHKLFV